MKHFYLKAFAVTIALFALGFGLAYYGLYY